MTILGAGKDKTIISGLDSTQIFAINPGVKFILRNLTITNGKSRNGGGILNNGDTTIDNCKFTKCITAYQYMGGGSAIASGDGSTLTVINSDFLNNDARSSSTGGGTIYTQGTTTIKNSNFIGNVAYSGAALFFNPYGDINLNVSGCNFINNAANTSGGVLTIYSPTGDTQIHFCSFINNMAINPTTTNNIDNRFNGALNISGNWWGTNAGVTGVAGSYTADNWIYMTLTVDRGIIKVGETSNVTANFNNLYNGTMITNINPANGHIPDGTSVNFSSDIGEITSEVGTIDGLATAIYTGTKIGTANITVVSAKQSLHSNIRIEPLTTHITVGDVSNFAGQDVPITAHVNDEDNKPVDGGNVIFTINGAERSASVLGGVATLTWTIPDSWSVGVNTILADYDDTGTIYGDSNTTARLTVTKTPSKLTVHDVAGEVGDTVTLKAHLTDYYDKPIAGASVKFDMGEVILTGSTDNNGMATVTYLLNKGAGTYHFLANFDGNTRYDSTSATGILTVNKKTAYLKVPNISGKNGDTINLKALLTDKNSNPLSGREVVFYLNGSKVGSGYTDQTGAASIKYLMAETGKLTVKAYFAPWRPTIDTEVFMDHGGTGNQQRFLPAGNGRRSPGTPARDGPALSNRARIPRGEAGLTQHSGGDDPSRGGGLEKGRILFITPSHAADSNSCVSKSAGEKIGVHRLHLVASGDTRPGQLSGNQLMQIRFQLRHGDYRPAPGHLPQSG